MLYFFCGKCTVLLFPWHGNGWIEYFYFLPPLSILGGEKKTRGKKRVQKENRKMWNRARKYLLTPVQQNWRWGLWTLLRANIPWFNLKLNQKSLRLKMLWSLCLRSQKTWVTRRYLDSIRGISTCSKMLCSQVNSKPEILKIPVGKWTAYFHNYTITVSLHDFTFCVYFTMNSFYTFIFSLNFIHFI